MANITLLWNGKANTLGEFSTDYVKGTSSGYFKTKNYIESWAGSGLIYDTSITTTNPYPISGTISSWSYILNDGNYDMRITDANYKITYGSDYNTIISGIISGKDHWYGDNKNNFFYFSVGGDTFHGGAGIDTVDAILAKRNWVTTSTKIQKDLLGQINITNFGNSSVILDSVERIRFSDVTMAFDLDGNTGKVVEIIGALFGKSFATNKEYVGIGLYMLDNGVDPLVAVDLAIEAALGKNYKNSDLINLVYKNITGVLPSPLDSQVFEGMLNNGFVTPRELTWAAADSALNKINVNLVGLATTGVDYIPFNS
jgi:serralysin